MVFPENLDLEWKRPGRCEAGHCPEVAITGDGNILVRTSLQPSETVCFTRDEWDALVAEMRSQHPFSVPAPGTLAAS